jgi:tetratricopeptide (TPR) repeat protein
MSKTRVMITTAITLLVVAGPAAGIQKSADGALAMAPPPDRIERAAELKLEAEALFPQPRQWKKAVRLLEQSAALRSASDPEAYTCLIYAGRIKAALGDNAGARVTLEKAAEHALARGAIVDAANAYIDAAHAAVQERDAQVAQQFLDRASLLADSPLLSVAQRTLLKSRLPA